MSSGKINVSIICEPAPIIGRGNEDACYFITDSIETLATVIDGASQRIVLPMLQEFIVKETLSEDTTTAAFVAQHTRNFIKKHPELSPFDLIAEANRELRKLLETIINPLSAENVAKLLPEYATLLTDDPRLLRLMLPACVITIVKINHAKNSLSFAHAGDTILYGFYKNGDIQQITGDSMDTHDRQALDVALKIKAKTGAKHLSDVLIHPEVIKHNVHNGIYHNYVDPHGKTDTSLGIGVVDGLPELDDYIQVGEMKIDSLSGILLCSDGIPLPSPINETESQMQARLHKMKKIIVEDGLAQYVAYLRQVEADDNHSDKYPRFKVHDDATAIFIDFS